MNTDLRQISTATTLKVHGYAKNLITEKSYEKTSFRIIITFRIIQYTLVIHKINYEPRQKVNNIGNGKHKKTRLSEDGH